MPVLGIETSGRSGTIAIVHEQKLLASQELSATGRRHARTLVPEIGNLLKAQNLTLKDLSGIAVSLGPGSFTGLRVGVVCAKTLAYSLDAPFVAVDTFLAVAENSGLTDTKIWIIDDALRGDVYAGTYHQNSDGRWTSQNRPKLMPLEELLNQIGEEDYISGPGVSKMEAELKGLNIVSSARQIPHATQIAIIGEQRILKNELDDYWKTEPHYIRRSAAEEKAAQS